MELYDEEVEKLLQEDIREKKRTGRGVFNRATRTGTIRGGIRTPVDLLKGKAKKEYIGNGKVKVSYMIMKFLDFKLLDNEGRREALSRMLEHHSRAEISMAWGVAKGTVNNYISRLGLSTDRKYTRAEEVSMGNSEVLMNKDFKTIFSVSLCGKFEGKDMKQRLSALELILDDLKKYKVEVAISELEAEE